VSGAYLKRVKVDSSPWPVHVVDSDGARQTDGGIVSVGKT